MSTQTYKEFKADVRGLIWPGGEPEKLVSRHDQFFLEAMIDLQKWVNPCLQQNNTTQFQACNLYWERYKTVAEMPKGKVSRLYTIANGNWQDKVWYQSSNIHELELWADKLNRAVVPTNSGLATLPMGFKYAEASTDILDSVEIGRARVGVWAIYRRRLYVAPWLQSNETLVMEWDGQKYDWVDTDLVDTTWWTPEVKAAVAFYVGWKHEFWYGDRNVAADNKRAYDQSLSDLIVDCREKTQEQLNEPQSEQNVWLTQEMADDDDVPAAVVSGETDYVVCLTGDLDGSAFADVAGAIMSHNPGKIILNGDISYGNEYEDIIGPYLDPAIVYPSIGNHNLDFDSTLAKYNAYFAATLKGNKRYYSHVFGPFHFFHLATDPREADGGYVDATTSTQGSIMGEWLAVQAAVSTAKYKISVGHHTPYTADTAHTPGERWMRWAFASMGIDLSLWSHCHLAEHYQVGGYNHINMGLGGNSIRSFGANPSGVTILKQYNSNYAFLKMTGNCNRILFEFINRLNEVVYSYTYTKS